MSSNASNTTSGTTKIDRVVNQYGLEGMGDELEERWLGTNDTEQSSTRELADYFNREILRTAIRESDTFTLSGDIEEVYRALIDDESGDATLVRSRLKQSGIDVESVTSSFVSHQTVHRYLKDHRGVERPERDSERKLADGIDVVQQLQGRTTAVTEQKIQTLKNDGIVSVSEFSVLNDVQVICENCGRSHEVTSFLEQGGCGCEGE